MGSKNAGITPAATSPAMPVRAVPVPGNLERGVVRPPNAGISGGNAANGYLPLTRGASGVRPPNQDRAIHAGDRRGGTADLNGSPSPVTPPNHVFDVGMAKMPQPPSAIEPGQGAVPVNPFAAASGLPTAAMRIPDTAAK